MFALVPAPKFAGLRTWDCGRCGREEVKPVFLAEDAGPATAYGTGCAAVLLGRPASSSRRIRAEAASLDRRAEQAEELLAERRARYARAAADFAAAADTPDLESCRRTYHQSGGSAVLGPFPGWLVRVAASGLLDR